MTIWICLEKSFRSHISAPGCRSFWNPLVRSELANFSVQANSARLFSCKIHEEVWKHKFGESTTTFSAICLCTFRSVQRWVGFLFTFDLTLIIMDLLIYLIYLLFVRRVSFGPTNIRNRLSPPAFEVGRSCPKRPWQMHWQSRRNHQSPVRPIRPFSEGMASGIKILSDAGIWQKGLWRLFYGWANCSHIFFGVEVDISHLLNWTCHPWKATSGTGYWQTTRQVRFGNAWLVTLEFHNRKQRGDMELSVLSVLGDSDSGIMWRPMTTLNGLDVLFAETLQAAQRGVSTGQAIWWVLNGFDSGICWSGDVWGYRNLCVLLCFAADVATFFPGGLFFWARWCFKSSEFGIKSLHHGCWWCWWFLDQNLKAPGACRKTWGTGSVRSKIVSVFQSTSVSWDFMIFPHAQSLLAGLAGCIPARWRWNPNGWPWFCAVKNAGRFDRPIPRRVVESPCWPADPVWFMALMLAWIKLSKLEKTWRLEIYDEIWHYEIDNFNFIDHTIYI